MDAVIGAMTAGHPFDDAVSGAGGNAAQSQGECGEPMAAVEEAQQEHDGEGGPKPAGKLNRLKDDVRDMSVLIDGRMIVNMLRERLVEEESRHEGGEPEHGESPN